jgi:DNA-binding IclR family transcriptional regulator
MIFAWLDGAGAPVNGSVCSGTMREAGLTPRSRLPNRSPVHDCEKWAMTRSSPGVRRVAAILNFMASHPGEAFALSDIVRALKLSRATCHALLTGLVEVGYLYRATDKTYVMGPALAAIGRAAAEHSSPLHVAKPEMRQLADRFDVVCGAYFLEGDTLHLRDRATSMSHVAYPVPLGTRMPLRSTQAAAFFADAPDEADAWLQRTEPKPSAERRALFFAGMEFVRDHGFLVIVRRPEFGATSLTEGSGADTDDLPVIAQPEVDPAASYPLAALMAPVRGSRGRVDFCLLMAGFSGQMPGAEIIEAGRSLHAASERIARFAEPLAPAA